MDNEMIAKMNGLVAKMKEAAEAYYNGQEIMSDLTHCLMNSKNWKKKQVLFYLIVLQLMLSEQSR